ncbi:glycolipid transfer protein domain-containing protein [Fimicolochytrium jonesii]|uniref:glycolipid transfer protein domain-containing protein n=1 Tax=Fimicolochytrium jonesii TaxID=1396493 RepID=UPI0022FE9F0C|nr:glycolipid transfer protein domain-containing protein [Fimicolochytrium jonesii]KAI8825990.1 glycolipid transfer protein domain-containing protein [Fimicolochytrium jonesii]
MPDFFESMQRSYVDVPVGANDYIDVQEFLEATESLTKLFDSMGAAFGPVKSDLLGNVAKLRTRYTENPTKNKTLQELVITERAEGKKTATEGLLWLKRGLEFTSKGLRRNLNDKNEELNVSFTKAYEETLSKHHSFMVRPVFSLAMKACPYRKEFYAKLGSDEAKVQAEEEKWLAALERIVAILNAFYKQGGYEKL